MSITNTHINMYVSNVSAKLVVSKRQEMIYKTFCKSFAVRGFPTFFFALQPLKLQEETGKSQSELVKEAIGLYLEKTDTESVAAMNRRLSRLEKQYKKLTALI